jgi:5-methylcytosine-specific restriction endonuclease McrA
MPEEIKAMPLQALTRRTLVLNRKLQVVNTVSAQDALGKVFTGQALIIASDFKVYDFDSWVLSWRDASLLSRIDQCLLIHSQNFSIPVPDVIVVSSFSQQCQQVRLSRRNIFLRDQSTCQYCGHLFSSRELNIDHVFPRSRGGKNTWENLVLSCFACNTRKADRTPEEARMPLLRIPIKPMWSELYQLNLNNSTPAWRNFLDLAYWNSWLDSN